MTVARFNSYSPYPLNVLSNFAPTPVTSEEGYTWATAEHMYQAAKFYLHADIERVKQAYTAADAKRAGKLGSTIPLWDEQKLDVMRRICAIKFRHNAVAHDALMLTGEQELVHEAPWDAFWGSGRDGRGLNHLGRILMDIRTELRKEQQS